jgi:hypothetical protein
MRVLPTRARLTGSASGRWSEKQLFDLKKDIGETHNIAKEYPEVLKTLSEKTNQFFSMIEPEIRPHAKMPDPSPIIKESEADALPGLDKWLKDIEGHKN